MESSKKSAASRRSAKRHIVGESPRAVPQKKTARIASSDCTNRPHRQTSSYESCASASCSSAASNLISRPRFFSGPELEQLNREVEDTGSILLTDFDPFLSDSRFATPQNEASENTKNDFSWDGFPAEDPFRSDNDWTADLCGASSPGCSADFGYYGAEAWNSNCGTSTRPAELHQTPSTPTSLLQEDGITSGNSRQRSAAPEEYRTSYCIQIDPSTIVDIGPMVEGYYSHLSWEQPAEIMAACYEFAAALDRIQLA